MQDESSINSIKDKLDRPIVLIGLGGAGKSHVGRLLGNALKIDLYDSDQEIEAAANMSINDIFEKFGEPHFRDGEHRVMKRLLDSGVCIISSGGGALTTEATAELVWQKALSIWIKADIETLVERISRNDKRPLLKNGDPYKIFEDMKEKRYPTYEKADIVFESRDEPDHLVTERIVETIYEYLRS